MEQHTERPGAEAAAGARYAAGAGSAAGAAGAGSAGSAAGAGNAAVPGPWPVPGTGGVPPGQRAGQAAQAAGQRQAYGEPRVDAALARLDELAGRPVTEHRVIFEDVHRRLTDVLGELDTRKRHSEDAAGAERRAGG